MWVLVTSATLAHLGHDVCCADLVSEKVAMLSRGEIPMVELGHSSGNSRVPATSKRSQTAKGVAWTSL
jgi:UDP-glucose 6-dehydrogenase